MGRIKNFFRKIGGGLNKAGRWIKEKALPVIGRVAKPILSAMSMIPGKLGIIGTVGSAVTNVLHNIVSNIPNKDARDKIQNTIARGNEKFQGAIDRGKELANGVNKTIGVGRDMINTVKDGIQNVMKPAVPPKVIQPMRILT